MPLISVTGGSDREGFNSNDDGSVDFIVTMSEASLFDVSVQYRTIADGAAWDRYDYFGQAGTLTFAPGEVQKTITVFHTPGNGDESDENYTLELHSAVNGDLASPEEWLRATGIVLDDDGSSANDLGLFVSDPRLTEGQSGTKQAVFEIRLSEASNTAITLPYATSDGTATAGEDYTARSGTITFAPGQTVNSVAVNVIGDTMLEGPETFSLNITPNGLIQNGVQDSSGVATILDEDTNTSLPVINIEGGASREGFNSNDDGSVDFTVTLSQSSLFDVTVEYRTIADGAAWDRYDYFGGDGTLTFAPGEVQKTITVFHTPGNGDEADENYTLELHTPGNAVLAGTGRVLSATGVVLDDDVTSANKLALFVSDPRIVEGDNGTTQAVFEVTLSRPSATAIALPYATADGTATAGQDYVGQNGTINFAIGQTVTSVTVDVIGDRVVERAETFSLNITPNGFIQNGVQDSSGVATILDEDTPSDLPVINIEGGASREGFNSNDDGWVDFVVTLSEASLFDVSVQFRTVADGSAIEGADYGGRTGVLTFVPGEVQKEIRVFHTPGNGNESDENYTLQLSLPQNGVLAGGERTLTSTGIVLDDDVTSANKLGLFVSDPVIAEGQSGTKQAVFEIQLSRPSETAITLPYATSDGTATAGVDYAATSGTLTFAPGQTVTSVAVNVFGDTTLEAAESFSLNVTPNGFIQNGTEDSSGVVTINNFFGLEEIGTSGNDRLIGTALNDTLFGGAGADFLSGGPGADTMNGGLGNDFYVVDDAGDQIVGEIAFSLGGGIDTVRSFIDYVQPNNIELVRLGNLDGTGNLNAVGNDAPGTLVGNAGDNILTGRGGNDQLNGNNGDDTITGNTGRDTLVGGAGDDTFIYTAYADSRAGGDARDLINGFDRFQNADDVIDLRQLDANTTTFGVDDAFDFIGAARFSGTAGELRYQGLGGPNAVIVEADHNGDRVADLQIFVNLTTFMTGSDFLL